VVTKLPDSIDRVFAAQGEEVLLKAAARLMHQKKAMAAAA
jgi:hypothetical protein